MASLYACGRTTAAIKQTTGIQNLDLESWLDNQVHVLPEAGQRAIAGFLDAETARISALVAKKRTLTAFVKERFETAVFAAVTHGLRGEPLKSSGLSWVEQIPQNW
jgi:type I restriction enzyme S subunit